MADDAAMMNNVPVALLRKIEAMTPVAAMVAGAIAAPRNFPPVRVKDGYSANPTAVASVHQAYKINWDTGVVPDPVTIGKRYIPQSDQVIFLFRNPLRHTIIYKRNLLSVPFVYTAVWDLTLNSTLLSIDANYTDWLRPAAWGNNTNGPHGPILFQGVSKNSPARGVWIDATPTGPPFTTLTLANSPVVQAGDILHWNIYRWVNGDWEFLLSQNNTAGQPSNFVNIMQPGYYAVYFLGDDVANPYTLSLSFSVPPEQGVVMEHRPMPNILQNINFVDSLRLTAVAGLYRNLASPLNSQGEITVAQVPNSLDWQWTFLPTTTFPFNSFYDNVFNLAQEHSSRLAKGAYAFLKINDDKDLDYIEDIEHGNAGAASGITSGLVQVTDATFPLEEASDYLVFAASATALGAGDGFFEAASHVEYETTNKWINRIPPSISRKDWMDGLEFTGAMQQYYENPMHLPSIMRVLGKVAEFAGPALSLLAPVTGPLAAPLEAVAAALTAGGALAGKGNGKKRGASTALVPVETGGGQVALVPMTTGVTTAKRSRRPPP